MKILISMYVGIAGALAAEMLAFPPPLPPVPVPPRLHPGIEFSPRWPGEGMPTARVWQKDFNVVHEDKYKVLRFGRDGKPVIEQWENKR